MAQHPKIDVARWKREFPLDVEDLPQWDEMQNIVGPIQFAHYLQLHDVITDTNDRPEPSPGDACIWNVGEPAARHLTKCGGVPFLPRESWPLFDGKPLQFYAQFCFIDSTDILPSLPGDVLLIFGQPADSYPGHYKFIWQSADTGNLMSASDLPADIEHFLPCFAAIHRTNDFEMYRPYARNTVTEDEFDWDSVRYPAKFHGTKIGGISTFVVGDLPEAQQWEDPGYFIAQLDHIGWRDPKSWPFANMPAGNWEGYDNPGYLEITGSGSMHLYLTPTGDIEELVYFS